MLLFFLCINFCGLYLICTDKLSGNIFILRYDKSFKVSIQILSNNHTLKQRPLSLLNFPKG